MLRAALVAAVSAEFGTEAADALALHLPKPLHLPNPQHLPKPLHLPNPLASHRGRLQLLLLLACSLQP